MPDQTLPNDQGAASQETIQPLALVAQDAAPEESGKTGLPLEPTKQAQSLLAQVKEVFAEDFGPRIEQAVEKVKAAGYTNPLAIIVHAGVELILRPETPEESAVADSFADAIINPETYTGATTQAPLRDIAYPESAQELILCGKPFGMEGSHAKFCTKPKGHQNSQDHGEKVCGYAANG